MVSHMSTPRSLHVYCAAIVAILASVSVAAAQSAPQGLTSTVNGTTVTLNWSASSGAASYLVEAALAPGGLPVASLPVGGTTLTVPNVPSGNYYVRVRAVAGGVSAPSNEVLVSVSSGCPGAPLPPRLAVRSTGLQASASWTSSGGCAPTSYTLFAGSAPGQSDITVVNAGGQLGVAATAPPGNYYVRVLGSNAYGSAMSEELLLRVAVNAQSDTVTPNGAVAIDVSITQSGTYQGALVWSDPSIDLDFYLTSPGCSYPPTGCLLAISDGNVGNSEQISYGVAAGQSYRLWVDNFSTRTSSFTIFNTISGNPLPAGDEREGAATSDLTIKKLKP
jgi:hypothetical protein